MANDLNRVMLVGRLVKDPELRHTPSGTSVANFSIANNKSYTKEGEKTEHVSYFECIAWGKLGEIIAQYCKKGKRVGIDGRLQQRSWQDGDGNTRYKVEVVAENFQFLDNVEQSQGTQQTQGTKQTPIPGFDQTSPFTDDDVPFQ